MLALRADTYRDIIMAHDYAEPFDVEAMSPDRNS